MTNKAKNTNGIKALLMVGSLVATLGGWGVMAAGQLSANVNNTVSAPVSAQAQSVQTNVGQVSTSANQPALRQVNPAQVNPPAVQSRSVARTRSSR